RRTPWMVACTVPPGRFSRSEMRTATPTLARAWGSMGSSGPPGAMTAAARSTSAGFAASISRVWRIPICMPMTAEGKAIVLRSGITGRRSGSGVLERFGVIGSEYPVIEGLGGAGELGPGLVRIRREQPPMTDDPPTRDHDVRHILAGRGVDEIRRYVRVVGAMHQGLDARVRRVHQDEIRGETLGDLPELAIRAERAGPAARGDAQDLLRGHGVRAVPQFLDQSELAHFQEQVIAVVADGAICAEGHGHAAFHVVDDGRDPVRELHFGGGRAEH